MESLIYAVIGGVTGYGLWRAITQILLAKTKCSECGREVSKRQGRVHIDKDYMHWSCFLNKDGQEDGR